MENHGKSHFFSPGKTDVSGPLQAAPPPPPPLRSPPRAAAYAAAAGRCGDLRKMRWKGGPSLPWRWRNDWDFHGFSWILMDFHGFWSCELAHVVFVCSFGCKYVNLAMKNDDLTMKNTDLTITCRDYTAIYLTRTEIHKNDCWPSV